jgi:hypothetical protein
MKYAPAIESLNRICDAPLGPDHTVLLFDQIKGSGQVEYALLLGVFNNQSEQPVYFVASELNSMREQLGGGSHFLGVFDDEGHANLGSSDDWGDPKNFFPEAVRIAKKHFGISE